MKYDVILLVPFFLFSQISFAQTQSNKEPELTHQSYQPSSNLSYSGLLIEAQSNMDQNLEKWLGQVPQIKEEAKALGKALILCHQNSPDEALNSLKKISENSILLPYKNWLIGLSYLKKNQAEKTLSTITSITSPKSKIDWELFWTRAEALARLGKTQELQAFLSPLEKSARNNSYLEVSISYYKLISFLKTKDSKAMLPYIKKILVDNAGSALDQRTTSLLSEENLSAEKILGSALLDLRAQKLIANGQAYLAVPIYKKTLHNTDDMDERLADAIFKSRDYTQSAELYKKLISQHGSDPRRASWLVRLAQSYARSDQTDLAIKTNKEIIKNFPGTNTAQQAFFKIGFLSYDAGDFKTANAFFQKQLPQMTGKKKIEGQWYLFWSHYFLKEYENALQVLTSYKFNNSEKEIVDYWKARCLEKTGKKQLATEIYRNLSRSDNLNFTSLLAEQRLRVGRLDSETIISKQWIKNIPNQKPELDVAPFGQNDTKLIRPVILSLIGLDEFAFDESESTNLDSSPVTLSRLHAAGDYYYGYTLRNRATGLGLSEKIAWTIAYPRAYSRYLDVASYKFSIPDSLPYAVMRQESVFKPEAKSGAFAYGLMQIIPPTAQEIVNDLSFEGFELKMLNKPIVSTHFGASYLGKLYRQMDNNLMHTIAAYNAGPEAVSRWKNRRYLAEADEFIENIPYSETRNYVKKVLVNYLILERMGK